MHIYISSMPLDGTRSIVHVKAEEKYPRIPMFISFERRHWVANGGFFVPNRTDIWVCPMSRLGENEGITKEMVKEELSKLHGCSPDGILVLTAKDYSQEKNYRRRLRYSHGQDPNMPPPGWMTD